MDSRQSTKNEDEIVKDIVYIELNNWFGGRDYPLNCELAEMVKAGRFSDDQWCKENKLCVYRGFVDMSINWCITASMEWVEENCPELLGDECYEYTVYMHNAEGDHELHYTKQYSDFLRYESEYGNVSGKFGPFLEYCEENFGITDCDCDEY